MRLAQPAGGPLRHDAGALQWVACLAVVLALHAGAVMLLLRQVSVLVPPSAPYAVLLELAPERPAVEPLPLPPEPTTPAAPIPFSPPDVVRPPEPPPPAVPQEPEPAQTTPTAPETLHLPQPEPLPPHPPAVVEPTVVLPRPPRPPPSKSTPLRSSMPHPVPQSVVPRQDAPNPSTTVPAPVPVQAAPHASAPAASADPSWSSEVSNKLARAKRYPDASRSRGEQGTVYATFTVDRAGQVLSARVSRGSGSYLLDEEAVALIHRAEPLPPMPAGMAGTTVTLTVPIAFSLR